MRTHIFNRMTAGEIDKYLASGKDSIFVALGVTEIHGDFPVEAETVLAEGLAVATAEKSDSLALINLPFFYPGGTLVGSGTVHTSLSDGFEYLWKILKSLVDQGFKRIFIVPGHGCISIMVRAFIRDFFEATHVHPILIELSNILSGAERYPKPNFSDPSILKNYEARAREKIQAYMPDVMGFENLVCGAYSIMGKVDELIVDPENETGFGERQPNNPVLEDFANRVRGFGGAAALLFEDPLQHGGGCVFKSEEERARVCAENEKKLREAIDQLDLEWLLKIVEDYQAYALRVCEKFPRFNKLAENN